MKFSPKILEKQVKRIATNSNCTVYQQLIFFKQSILTSMKNLMSLAQKMAELLNLIQSGTILLVVLKEFFSSNGVWTCFSYL